MNNQSAKLTSSGVRYLIRILLQLLLQITILIAAAGIFTLSTRIYAYILIMSFNYLISIIVIARYNSEVLNERTKNMKINTKAWDKILLSLYVVLTFIIMNVFIGLSIRFQWVELNVICFYPGLLLYITSVIISNKSLIENKYFESSSRIQADRNQTVVSTGIYSVVRHPGYVAILIWSVSIPLLTGIFYSIIPSALIIAVIVIRTFLEDKMLKEELAGYLEYTQRVKYRLVPYIW